MTSPPDPSRPATFDRAQILAVLERARSGDASALAELRQILDDHPEIWKHYGALADHARRAWIDLIAGTDLTLKESLDRQLEAMKADLTGPEPSTLETLLVERIQTCWLQTYHADVAATRTEGLSPKQADFTVKQQDSAHRRYLMAVATLALTRRLLATAKLAEARAAKVPSRSGDQPVDGSGEENRGVLGFTPTHKDLFRRKARKRSSSRGIERS